MSTADAQELRRHSFVVIRLSADEAKVLQRALAVCRSYLSTARHGREPGVRVVRQRHCQVTAGHWDGRSQVRLERVGRLYVCGSLGMCCTRRRCEPVVQNPSFLESALLSALDEAWTVMANAAMKLSPPSLAALLPRSSGIAIATESVLDAFYYPVASSLAAHEDSGVLTVIAEDAPGLEVLDKTTAGQWIPLELGESEIAVIICRAWAKAEVPTQVHHPKACMHRVCPNPVATNGRCSLSFELRLSRTGQLTVAKAEAAAFAEQAKALGSPTRRC